MSSALGTLTLLACVLSQLPPLPEQLPVDAGLPGPEPVQMAPAPAEAENQPGFSSGSPPGSGLHVPPGPLLPPGSAPPAGMTAPGQIPPGQLLPPQPVVGFGSYLHRLKVGPDGFFHRSVEPYIPHEADIVFFEDHSPLWGTLFIAAGSGMPTHCGMVIRRPDGVMCLVEAGPDWKPGVYVQEANTRLQKFKGTIWIRRCRHPLSPEASWTLTNFALAQEGKPYAVGRLLLQGTPFRCRYGLRYKCFARTYMQRHGWLCSELVVACGTLIGLFDPHIHPANAIYPRDIIDEDVYPMIHNFEDIGVWSATPQPPRQPICPR